VQLFRDRIENSHPGHQEIGAIDKDAHT
jgi:hypothetical protein